MQPLVLVIHHDTDEAKRLADACATPGLRARYETDSLDGLLAVEETKPALIVLDWHLPFIDGAIFLRALRAWSLPPPAVLALVATESEIPAVQRAGACGAVLAPVTSAALAQQVTASLKAGSVPSLTARR